MLPAFVAASDARLVRLLPQHHFKRTFWMSMPQEARQLPRMQAVWALLRELAEREQPRLLAP